MKKNDILWNKDKGFIHIKEVTHLVSGNICSIVGSGITAYLRDSVTSCTREVYSQKELESFDVVMENITDANQIKPMINYIDYEPEPKYQFLNGDYIWVDIDKSKEKRYMKKCLKPFYRCNFSDAYALYETRYGFGVTIRKKPKNTNN